MQRDRVGSYTVHGALFPKQTQKESDRNILYLIRILVIFKLFEDAIHMSYI